MINTFTIHNFRGIKSLEIDDIKQLNLFLGYNNCGKSSVLEALYLFGDPSHPANDIQINRVRHYLKADRKSLPLNFYNLDTSESIKFQGVMNNGQEKRELRIDFFEQNPNRANLGAVTLTSAKNDMIYGLRNVLHIKNKDQEQTWQFVVEPFSDTEARIINNKANNKFQNSFSCGYMQPGSNPLDYLSPFQEIIENKEEQNIVEALKEIEPDLQGIALVDDQIMADIGIQKLIPIQLLGDGIRKLFSIIIFIYQLRGGMAMIDEIDNGLHFHSMPTLWKTVIYLSEKYDVQLFITTHNIDSLKALSMILSQDWQSFQDRCNVYTLRKKEQGLVDVIRSTYSQFDYMITQEMELR